MKVQELVERFEDRDFFEDELEKELEIKKYIPVMEKKRFVTDVISECTDDIDGYITVDKFYMDIYFYIGLLKLYTNLEVAPDFDEMVAQCDMLCERGVFKAILKIIADDYNALKNVLNYELDNLLKENSLECQVVKIANKINEITNVVGEKIDGFDFNSILPEGVDMEGLSNIISMLK